MSSRVWIDRGLKCFRHKTEGGDGDVAVRAVRGAIQLDADESDHILGGVAELVATMLDHNAFVADDVVTVIFTATPDLRAEFPAYAARLLGMTDVPLLCAQEIDVAGAMPRVVRALVLVETTRPRAEIRHVYLRGAAALRTDLPK